MDDFDTALDKKIERRMSSRQHSWFYISGSAPDKKGRMRGFLLGPYSDYDVASRIVESKRLTSYEIFEDSSSDMSKVSQKLKARKLHGGASMADIFDKVKHTGVGQPVEDSI